MGGYYIRSIYAIEDLKKLIHYKTARGISFKWQGTAYSYLMAFCRIAHLEPLDVPEGLPLVPVSAKATNDVICHDLRITEKMVQHLELETLRPDYDQHRQDRHSWRVGRSTREVYLQNCKDQSQQQLALVQHLLNQGLSKSAVARRLHLSRKHIYHLINNEEALVHGNSRIKGQVQQG